MHRALVPIRVASLVLWLSLLLASPAVAHDCSSQSDCEQTTGYISGISVIGGIIAILTGVLGSQLGGGLGGSIGGGVGGGVGTAEPPTAGGTTPRPEQGFTPGRDGTTVVPEDFPGPPLPGQVRPSELPPEGGESAATPQRPERPYEPTGGEGPEIPWDELIGATEPPESGGEGPTIDELLGGEPVDEPGTAEPAKDPIDELLGEPTGGGEDDPLAGEPGIDDLVPIDELLGPEPGEPPEKVKPPILEVTEKGTDIAGQVKDVADTVKEFGEEVGDAVDNVKDVMGAIGDEVSDTTRKTVDDTLETIGDAASGVKDYAEKAGEIAEQVKEVGEKAGEYMNALNDNLEKTEQLGLTDDSQNFLGWWRVTIKAAGELTEKFVDGITSPVTKLLGEKYGEKAQDLLHDAVPVKEFGEELSKFPTSAAEHVVNAQQRDQIAENVNLVPKGDAGYIELDDLYPGRKWP